MAPCPRIPDEVINWDILNEIVSMDEDDAGFSHSLIVQFFDQASTTFDQMQLHLDGDKDLVQLGQLGHFLKGSSASLGLQRIAWVCERIQNYGQRREGANIGDEKYIELISGCVDLARKEFLSAKKELAKFYKTEF